MRIYLVRHGEAKSKDVDLDRHLTEKGIGDVEQIAGFLKQRRVDVCTIWHSGKVRAAQTADILALALAMGQADIKHEGLAPNDPIGPVKNELTHTRDDLMIVGHLPFLSKLASALLVGDELIELFSFQQAGVVCLGRNDEEEQWQVCWMVVPQLCKSENNR